ncbi:MAG: M24 family metallopeptidase [Chloroflexi bacterium]|nr:M24 family metallopeptidase [Chloroflexota bacterium]
MDPWSLHASTYSPRPAKLQAPRQRAEIQNRWLRVRLEELLPKLMARAGLEMWIVVARENNEDPVAMTFLPAPLLSARRRTILVFCRRGDGSVERFIVSRYGVGDLYQAAWDAQGETEWACLRRLVAQQDPSSIGVNVSANHALADGLSHNEHGELAAALGEPYAARLQSAQALALGWLEARSQDEVQAYAGIVELAHALNAEALSSRTVHPGVTTTDDLVWWYRQRMEELGLRPWFHPTVDIQAAGLPARSPAAADEPPRKVILPGDLIHTDVGFEYLGLCTDVQQNAYVLRLGESAAPPGLRAALADGNRTQEIVLEEMRQGRSGNEVFLAALARCQAEDLRSSIYCHPIGYHGHGAGPSIGMWDQQAALPGKGDYPLYPSTCYAIELNAVRTVPEWQGQEVTMALEEDAVFTGSETVWLDGRQAALYLIR